MMFMLLRGKISVLKNKIYKICVRIPIKENLSFFHLSALKIDEKIHIQF